MVFNISAHGQPNRTAEITHSIGVKEEMEGELKTPKNSSSENPHEPIEYEQLCVMPDAFGFEIKYILFLQNVLDREAHRCACQYRQLNRISVAVNPNYHGLRKDVGEGGQGRDQGVHHRYARS